MYVSLKYLFKFKEFPGKSRHIFILINNSIHKNISAMLVKNSIALSRNHFFCNSRNLPPALWNDTPPANKNT